MGSTTPPDSSNKELQHSERSTDLSKSDELEQLLKVKDQEIRLLRLQLEKYKLALNQSQVEHQHQQQRHLHPQTSSLVDATKSVCDNDDSLLGFPQEDTIYPACSTAEAIVSDVVGKLVDDDDETIEPSPVKESLTKESSSQKTSRLPATERPVETSLEPGSSSRVIFKAGADGDDDHDDGGADYNIEDEESKNLYDTIVASSPMKRTSQVSASQSDRGLGDGETDDNELYSVIQDVGEIDLNLELKEERKKRHRVRAISLGSDMRPVDKDGMARYHRLRARDSCDEDQDQDIGEVNNEPGNDDENVGDDDDIISDGLLTSLTDAAISNLSQLAALQERCESQDSAQQQLSDHSLTQQGSGKGIDQRGSSSSLFGDQTAANMPHESIVSPTSTASSSCLGALSRHSDASNRDLDGYNLQNPFSASNIANQAALAISAAAAAMQQDSGPSAARRLSYSQASSVSPASSTLQPDLSSNQSLASVVAAAAAAAAAAASDHQQTQHHPHPHPHPHPAHNQAHQLQATPQSRLISSALSSPEFYQNLHQQHQRTQVSLQQQQQMSPLSALHHAYSPATPISPSPSSLLALSRRPGSNTSSSFMSPISSPSYLRRQFMPDRLSIISPSSTSLTTGSSSAASTSLAHILQHHHHQQQQHQQRSSSALAGPITSASSTPLSGTGSSVMSPLVGSKGSSQARLNTMQIRHKFGYLGSGRGQFNSPHGFCLGLNQEIVVADTNNHRICIFDKSGSYITQFGSPGKEEGQLWNPRKVAILHRAMTGVSGAGSGNSGGGIQPRQMGQVISTYSSHFTSSGGIQSTSSGSSQLVAPNVEPLYVVCDRGAERSRMQLFTKDGSFIKKIGIHYIDIVAGLAITQNGLIIVVDSVSPTVYIINADTGTLNGWFDCSGHMKEPSDIAVKSEIPGNEYFICDFKGHCVVVFNEQGEYLRKIGHDGLTSYPNGIDISDDGDILVGDSHGNRFHVVVFDRNGNFVSQFECPHVKVSRCCGLKITREGYIVTLAKNNHHVLVLDTIHI